MTHNSILRDLKIILRKDPRSRHTCPPPPSHPSSPTFALGHRGGAVEVGGGVARTGDAVILPKIGLVGAHGAADAAMDAGVVVMPRGALDWGGGQRAKGAASATDTAPLGAPLPGDRLRPTLGVAVLEGEGSLVTGAEPPAAGEAERPPHLRLVGPAGTRLAGLEAIGRVLAWGTLTCGHRRRSVLAPRVPQAPPPHAQLLSPQPWQHR